MMRKLFQSLFGWPCDHDWEILLEKHLTNYITTDIETGKVFDMGKGFVWLYRCKKCCKRKKVTSK